MVWVCPLLRELHLSSRWVILAVSLSSLFEFTLASTAYSSDSSIAKDNTEYEFSARLTWRVDGKTSRAQLFVKKDRYRIEHFGGIKTDLGYAGVMIVRLDEQKVWYVLSKRRLVVSVPLTVEVLLPFSVRLDGETSRTLIGESMAGGRPAELFEVVVSRDSQTEKYYEWVDAERGLLLKLLSQDRDWSVVYEHIVNSKQPDYYFETPLGYKKLDAQGIEPRAG